jgi:GDPmannose 4,6-dehydratase
MSTKKALITGITGQDGSYLAELLLNKGYDVHGVYRRSSLNKIDRLNQIYQDPQIKDNKLFLHYGDCADSSSLARIIQLSKPDEIYNLAAQSHVKISFETPEYTANADAIGPLRMLEAMRILGLEKQIKFFQASTSEMFGRAQESPQNESTPFYPRSPYGVAKLFAHWITINYREAYDIFAVCGIMFNHESPRRGDNFVSKKITDSAVKIARGEKDCLYLGNLEAKRDWGYAKEYVEAIWLTLQQDKPEDYVIATGETHTVRELVEEAFKYVDLEIAWEGEGLQEKGLDKKTGRTLVAIDPYYFRPTEVDTLIGDASKIKKRLNWAPQIKFKEVIKIMMEAELKNNNG